MQKTKSYNKTSFYTFLPKVKISINVIVVIFFSKNMYASLSDFFGHPHNNAKNPESTRGHE